MKKLVRIGELKPGKIKERERKTCKENEEKESSKKPTKKIVPPPRGEIEKRRE